MGASTSPGSLRKADGAEVSAFPKHQSYSEKDLMIECAGAFGFLIADAEKNGLSIPVAFEMAKNHLRQRKRKT